MRRQRLLLLLMALFVAFAAGCGQEKEESQAQQAYLKLTDAAGRSVVLEHKPQRVISLSPSYLSMIDSVGGSVVGRASSKVGSIPASMRSVPEVGFVYNINMETLVSLKPDLVLAGRNQHDKFVPLLESNKIKVLELDAKTYPEVKDTLRILGNIYGTQAKAEAECALLDKEIAGVTAKLPVTGKTVAIMHATASSVTIEGESSIAGCAAAILGLRNIAAAAVQHRNGKITYSMESLAEQDPEIIFITSMGKAEEIENRLRTDFKNNPAWGALRAVRQGRVYALPEDLFLLNPGLKYPEAVKYMAARAYPEVFSGGK